MIKTTTDAAHRQNSLPIYLAHAQSPNSKPKTNLEGDHAHTRIRAKALAGVGINETAREVLAGIDSHKLLDQGGYKGIRVDYEMIALAIREGANLRQYEPHLNRLYSALKMHHD